VKISVQVEDFQLLKEAVDSNCTGLRFGSEFCEYKIPGTDVLERAYELVHGEGKEFIYVTPRLSNSAIEKIRRQLVLLNEKGEVGIVVNDLGVLNVLGHYRNLHPHIGRQLIRVPARSPLAGIMTKEGLTWKRWGDSIVSAEGGFLVKRWYKEAFSYTSLNYRLTIELFRTFGARDVDVDWIPRTFPRFDFLMKRGLNLSVHLHLAPVTIARRCHTARFVGEKSPEECSKPCLEKSFLLRNDFLGLELFLCGNVVFSFTCPCEEDIKQLKKSKVAGFVLTMNSVTGIDSRQKIDNLINHLG